MKEKKNKEVLISEKTILTKYHFTRGLINKYVGEVFKYGSYNYGNTKIKLYREADVLKALENKECKKEIEKRLKKKTDKIEKKKAKEKAFKEYLESFDIKNLIDKAKEMDRYFILHVGPTNSGKTYDSIEALKKASTGVYLGPLRLLALEMYDKLNLSGKRCNLLTGEENINVEGATITSSTIELFDKDSEYEVAVIDEAQMIADNFRGDRWTKAIYLINAREVHICLAPEALNIIINIINSFNGLYKIVKHERLSPLKYGGRFNDFNKLEKGDAIIVFSRKSCLQISSYLKEKGIKSSVIYGALPPESRREEVRKFSSGETTVVVSTDAIGMGVSLPIKRIIFKETEKFDGEEMRNLLPSEIKQIAGRAGRFGIYDTGFFLSMEKDSLIKSAIENEFKDIDYITIPFPKEVIDSSYDILELLEGWNNLEAIEGIRRADMSDQIALYNLLKKRIKMLNREEIFKFINIPMDTKNYSVCSYYLDLIDCYINNIDMIEPNRFGYSLEDYETLYKEYDLYHNFLRVLGIKDDISLERKKEISNEINKILKRNKKNYQKRCKICDKVLDINHKFNICDECFKELNRRKRYD